jgi:hypothetical protein
MMKSILAMLAAVGVLVLTSGCVVVAVGAVAAGGVATYAYVNGQLETSLASPLDKTFAATQAAMKDLEFKVTKTTKDAVNAEVDSTTSDGKTITVVLKRVSEGTTEVHIRVDKFGDEKLSNLILEKIKGHLG